MFLPGHFQIHLYNRPGVCNLRRMQRLKSICPLLLLPLLVAGCTSITNLTPSKMERNASGLYPVEAAWKTQETAIRQETITPYVMVGLDQYPMQPTPLVKNRWETLIPIPPEQNSAYYRFRFDYDYDAVPQRQKDSKLSPEYKLEIVD
jgi:hypothetical protein